MNAVGGCGEAVVHLLKQICLGKGIICLTFCQTNYNCEMFNFMSSLFLCHFTNWQIENGGKINLKMFKIKS